jgi:hypothetical protein
MRAARMLGAIVTAALIAGPGQGTASASPEGAPSGGAASAPEKKGPPFADGPDAKAETKPKPATRSWNVAAQGFAYTFSFAPGIPDPDQLAEILVVASELPKVPHPRYGNRLPVDGARITVEVTNPAGQLVGRYRAHPMPLSSSKYGLHFTPSQAGLYTLDLRGKTADGKELSATVKLPVATWPLPKELEGTGAADGASSVRSVIRTPVGN